ncbi:hypothetical protein KP79_PYT03385 [Mizuhopecten yessoensis]|uniref:DED domain-containing protein n=1 Tax=Mizuhopecten yessoensis TaxID=6573 RepID=A0A210PDF0_MIZYE|nr:hypothetical protein KP79_PYT03385 [Mizuhopecten yessoensis]
METMETSDAHDDDNNMDEDNLITPVWRFNIFLDKIGQDLSEEEITRMKSFCRDGDIGRSALNKAKTATSFFQLLRDMEFLNCNNLLQLQAMLWHIGRKDLQKEMVAFAQACRKEPLHFFTPKETPGIYMSLYFLPLKCIICVSSETCLLICKFYLGVKRWSIIISTATSEFHGDVILTATTIVYIDKIPILPMNKNNKTLLFYSTFRHFIQSIKHSYFKLNKTLIFYIPCFTVNNIPMFTGTKHSCFTAN